MATITKHDFITSIRDALQYISYYHPPDFIKAMSSAYKMEQSAAAKDAIAQILINSRMCAEGHRPICQDTGIVVVYLDIGMAICWKTDLSIEAMINEAVHLAYTDPDNPLRASMVSDPAGERKNTGDNTPAVIHINLVPGDKLNVFIAAKGGGSENKSKFSVLNPGDNVSQWVIDTVLRLGAGWCPPGILGIGIGGTAEKAMLLAKRSLMEPINIQALQQQGATTTTEKLRLEIYQKVNALGIGAQGLGGLHTVLDVKVLDYPTHAASKPIALIPNCAATRHIHFELNGNGAAVLPPPRLEDWPDITQQPLASTRHVNLNTITKAETAQWRPGDTLLISGTLLTARDAAHKRIAHLLTNNQPLPHGVDFANRFIYYVGPVAAVGDEVVGPAGPTTSTRMDKFTHLLLEKTGLIGMIGKAERGPDTIQSIKKHGAVYLIATGGAAYLVSKSIRSAKIVAFEDLGMEAIHEFEVENMPVTVAVDSQGESIHRIGPAKWRQRIAGIPIRTT
ncbi:MAG: fumarate hydratase [Gammaproteobacteria bacterium]|nr:fumarate hydratase [Gammaproteobacteria bacterium]